MKLTKLQRYTIYCVLLSQIETGDYAKDCGLCYLWSETVGNKALYELFKKTLPELYKKRYPKSWYYYFVTWEERAEALKQCIIETHPK